MDFEKIIQYLMPFVVPALMFLLNVRENQNKEDDNLKEDFKELYDRVKQENIELRQQAKLKDDEIARLNVLVARVIAQQVSKDGGDKKE